MANPNIAYVNVALNSVNPTQFSVTPAPSPPPPLPTGPNGDLIFNNNGKPGFQIYFNLTDNTGLGYKFPPNSKKDEAVWSTLGANACPSAQGNPKVFTALRVEEPQCMTLVVQNPNAGDVVGTFSYTLRVTTDGGTTYLPLDPGGINQNGPVTKSEMAAVVAFAVGAVAGAAAALVVAPIAQQVSIAGAAAIGGVAFLAIYLIVSRVGRERTA